MRRAFHALRGGTGHASCFAMTSRIGWFLVVWSLWTAGCSATSESQQQGTEGGTGSGSSEMGSSSGSATSGSSSGVSGTGGSSGAGSSGGVDAAAGDSTTPDSAAQATDAEADETSPIIEGDAGTCATCGTGHVCVENQTVGGARILPNDAGQCPPGLIVVPNAPNACSSPPTFHCAPLPPTCTTAPGSTAIAHCACAPSICAAGERCTDLTPTLMQCLLAAP